MFLENNTNRFLYSDNNSELKSLSLESKSEETVEIKTQETAKKSIPGPIPHDIPKLETIDPESLYSQSDLSDLMKEAKELVTLEFAFAKAKKEANGSSKDKKEAVTLPARLKELRKTFLSSTNLGQKEAFEKTLKVRCALYYAWVEKEAEIGNKDTDISHISNYQKKECLEIIAKTKIKQGKAYDTPLACISNKEKDQIPSFSPHKFSCVANENCPQKSYEKNSKIGSWVTEIAPLGKELKRELKTRIKKKIEDDIFLTGNKYGPRSFPLKIALEEFRSQYNKIAHSQDIEFKVHYEAINDIIRLFEAYGKNNGILQTNSTFQLLLLELVKKSDANLEPIYAYTEEYYQKRVKCDLKAIPLAIDSKTAKRIEDFLKRTCNFLENELTKAQSEERQEQMVLSENVLNDITVKISTYFEKLIKIHKNLSHNRFIDLPSIHTSFINNLHYALSKLEITEKDKIKSLVEEVVKPEFTLLETEKHRSRQGSHDPRVEKKEVYKHSATSELNKYVRLLTISDAYDMISLEAAHVIPFPALFARKDRGIEKRESKKNNLTEFQVSKTYLEQNKDQKTVFIQKDIDLIYSKHKNNPEEYVDHVLEFLMKIYLEESSRTVHIPSVFNQEIDAASEKYIETEEKETLDLLTRNKKINKDEASSKSQENSKVKIYSEKVYKYILGIELFKMVKAGKKMEYSQVLDQEKEYFYRSKLSIAKRMNWLSSQPASLTLLVIAICLCNVFYGIKNAEAKGNKDFTEGEKELKEGFMKLQHWLKASEIKASQQQE